MTHSLRVTALSLGAANAIDFALQFLLPVILARVLDTNDFGVYRLFWLVTSTVLALSVLGIPQSLYYFLPRSKESGQRLYINQAIIFLVITGILSAVAILPGSPLLPDNANILSQYGLLLPLFALLWIVSSTLDFLPSADGRPLWQAKAIIALAIVRTLVLGGVAMLTGSVTAVLWALLGFVIFKLSLLVIYIVNHHGWAGPYITKATFREQTTYAIPFGLAGLFFNLRAHAEQWVAASLFSISQYAAFSVASILAPLVALFRQSMNQIFLPQMSKHQADGDVTSMLDMNNRANVALALLLFPIFAFAFVFSDSLISLIYTKSYAQGGDVMRVYVFGMIALSVEVNNVMFLLKEGHFATRINFLTLCICISSSFIFAKIFGLPGAAIGSVLAVYVDRVLTLRRISRRLKLPLSALQDWSALGKILIAATVSAVLTWVVSREITTTLPVVVQLGISGLVLSGIYLLSLFILGMRTKIYALLVRRH